MSSVIGFDHVTKRFGRRTVLEDVSFTVNERDVVGIFGRSGAGKSTLLSLAARLDKPSNGRIECSTVHIGYAFQEPRVLPWKTTLDNVALPLVALGLTMDEARERARRRLLDMGLEGFEQHYPSQLSGGMVQRVSLARAFAVEPEILFLDEPFGALDIALKDVMFALLKKQLEAHPATVLYVSHVPEDVVRIATRLFVLDSHGRLRELPLMGSAELEKELRDVFG